MTTQRPAPSTSAGAPTTVARTRPRRSRLAAIAAAGAVALLAVTPGAASGSRSDGESLAELQRRRSQVQAQRAKQAAQVNALEATDAEVTAALQALTANVNAQQDRVEEAERAVAQANADRVAAEQAQAQAQAELDALRERLRQSAVEAYVSMGSSEPLSTIGVDDINDAVNKRTIIAVRQNENVDLAERYRSVQEDLEIQRAAAAEAEERARVHEQQVEQRLAELRKAHAEKQAFADQVDRRIEAALAEAESLAAIDSKLASTISAKQAEIARAVAAQRAAEAARAAQRSASNRRTLVPSGGGGGGGGTPPNIVGSGEIVTVGGIRVHHSIAGNLQALLAAAAADGIHFGGGGYRDPSGQIAVRRNNCGSSDYAIYHMPASSCRPPTARPGQSMHERGLAIDFTQNGSTLTRGSSGFAWLQANAGRFGFRNLPSEPWHWSTNGN